MSWKKILKEEEFITEGNLEIVEDEDEDVTEALDKLEALYYELSQLDMDGVLDSRVPYKIEEALLLVHRKV